jgi:hypothetical protein
MNGDITMNDAASYTAGRVFTVFHGTRVLVGALAKAEMWAFRFWPEASGHPPKGSLGLCTARRISPLSLTTM